jgi:large repetitive protein
VSIIDRFPAGFHYVEGSARVDGQALEPVIRGRELEWNDLEFVSGGQHTIKLLLAVGAGVTEGEFVNRAQVIHSLSRNPLSEEATATVRLVPDPTFDCTDVMGKVFDDANRNGVQDEGERGIAGVRLVTARGLSATTDEHGRYHITCAITPREDRGSNFILKLDDRTLPSGFRASTDQLQVKRATRGKALRFNFGASIHRVVGLDIADAVFEPGSTQMRAQWKPRLQLLLDELRRSPAVLRLSYLADIEDPGLVERRLNAVRKSIVDAWVELDCCYQLDVEPVVFWRLGSPPEERLERVGRGR